MGFETRLRTVVAIIVFLTPFAAPAASHAPGVPEPPICIDAAPPAAPPEWPAREEPGFYYVNPSVENATDAGNPYGSRHRPRRSMPVGELPAGSYVELHGGPYDPADIRSIARGTPAEPVWIRGADRLKPTVVRAEWLASGAFFIIENLKFDRSRRNLALVDANDACVRYNVFAGPGRADGNSAVIFVGAGTGKTKVNNNVIYKNKIYGFGDADSCRENDYHGILIGAGSTSTWLLENEIFDNGGDAIQVGGTHMSGDTRPQRVYIAGNRMYSNRENAVDIKNAIDVVVSANEIHDYRPTSSSEGAGIVIHDGPEHVWILDNTVSDAEIGIISTGSRDTWLIGNMLFDIRNSLPDWNPESAYAGGAAIHFRGASSGGVIGNTFAYCDIGLQLAQGGASGYSIYNNIFAFGSSTEGDDVHVASGRFSEVLAISHNLHYRDGGAFRNRWAGRSFDSLRALSRSSGQFANSVIDDPAFVDGDARDFRLRPGSPAIGAGMQVDISQRFRERYGITLGLWEREGPTETAVDIGALAGAATTRRREH